MVKPCDPCRTVKQVEIATLKYVDRFIHRRLFQACGDIQSPNSTVTRASRLLDQAPTR